MKTHIFSLLLGLLTLSITHSSYAKSTQSLFFEEASSIYNEKSCFRRPFDSYESWANMIRKGSLKRSANKEEAEQRFANVERWHASMAERSAVQAGMEVPAA